MAKRPTGGVDPLGTGLPSNPDAERAVLGSALQGDSNLELAASLLMPGDFSLDKHRLIFAGMLEVREAGAVVNSLTLAERLQKNGQLQRVDGLTYLASLTDGLPELADYRSYIDVVREKSRLRGIIYRAKAAMEKALLQEPSEEIVVSLGRSLDEIGVEQTAEGRGAERIIEEFPGGISAFLDPTLRAPGVMTGFWKLDEMLNGFHKGSLTFLGARPSVGKTALALNITSAAVKKNYAVPFFSLEMSAASLLERLLCAEARVDQHRFRQGYLNQEERRRVQEALERIINWPLRIYDVPGIGLAEFSRHVRQMAKQGCNGSPLGLVVLDYIQLMSVGRAENRNVAVGDISRGIKMLALDVEVPILALSQLSRPHQNSRMSPPTLQDLRDTGSLEQDADNVLFIWREELLKRDREDLKGLADLIVAKQRNGPIGTAHLRFLGSMGRFENKAEDTPDVEPPPRQREEW